MFCIIPKCWSCFKCRYAIQESSSGFGYMPVQAPLPVFLKGPLLGARSLAIGPDLSPSIAQIAQPVFGVRFGNPKSGLLPQRLIAFSCTSCYGLIYISDWSGAMISHIALVVLHSIGTMMRLVMHGACHLRLCRSCAMLGHDELQCKGIRWPRQPEGFCSCSWTQDEHQDTLILPTGCCELRGYLS